MTLLVVAIPLRGQVITIGPDGGEVHSPDHRVTLTIPAGALRAPVAFQIAADPSAPLDAGRVGTAYKILPEGTTLAAPATLRMSYDGDPRPSGSAAGELALGTYVNNIWQPIESSRVDTGTSLASGMVTSTGVIAVGWYRPTGCSDAGSRAFDFMLGAWDFVVDERATGDQLILPLSKQCGLREVFAQRTYRASSITFLSSLDQKWHQTFVDSDGARRILNGGPTDTGMVMVETPTQRYRWTVLAPGRVRWTEERLSGSEWQTSFTATYIKRP